MNSLHPPSVKIPKLTPINSTKSLSILKWYNYQQNLEKIETKISWLKEELEAYNIALSEIKLQIAEIEKELLLS